MNQLARSAWGRAGRGLVEKLGFGPWLMDPIGFVMSRKMLRTIRTLAEGLPVTRGVAGIPARSGHG